MKFSLIDNKNVRKRDKLVIKMCILQFLKINEKFTLVNSP